MLGSRDVFQIFEPAVKALWNAHHPRDAGWVTASGLISPLIGLDTGGIITLWLKNQISYQCLKRASSPFVDY
jgi:hypothetical protein